MMCHLYSKELTWPFEKFGISVSQPPKGLKGAISGCEFPRKNGHHLRRVYICSLSKRPLVRYPLNNDKLWISSKVFIPPWSNLEFPHCFGQPPIDEKCPQNRILSQGSQDTFANPWGDKLLARSHTWPEIASSSVERSDWSDKRPPLRRCRPVCRSEGWKLDEQEYSIYKCQIYFFSLPYISLYVY